MCDIAFYSGKKSHCFGIWWLVDIGKQIRISSRENAKILQHRACNRSLLLVQHWIILLFFHPLGFLSPGIDGFAGTIHMLDNALWYHSSCRVGKNEVFKLEGKILHVFSFLCKLGLPHIANMHQTRLSWGTRKVCLYLRISFCTEDFLKQKKALNLEHFVQLSSELIVGACLVPLWFKADGRITTYTSPGWPVNFLWQWLKWMCLKEWTFLSLKRL